MPLSSSEKLAQTAKDELKRHKGDVTKAASSMVSILLRQRELLQALIFDYLKGIGKAQSPVGDPKHLGLPTAADGAQSRRDDQFVSGSTVAVDTEPKISVSEHKVSAHKRRTPEQKAAALAAAMLSADAIFDRVRVGKKVLGDLHWRELRACVKEQALVASNYLQLGLQDTEVAILLDKIEAYGKPADESVLVRNFVSAETANRLREEARLEAARLVTEAMSGYAKKIEQRREALA